MMTASLLEGRSCWLWFTIENNVDDRFAQRSQIWSSPRAKQESEMTDGTSSASWWYFKLCSFNTGVFYMLNLQYFPLPQGNKLCNVLLRHQSWSFILQRWVQEIFQFTPNLMHARSLQSCLTLCNPMDCSPPGSSVHGILQARILEWLLFPSSGDLPDPEITASLLLNLKRKKAKQNIDKTYYTVSL